MKRVTWMILAVLVLLAGCGEPAPTVPSTTEETAVPVRQLYADACSAVETAGNLILDYTVKEERVIGENSFSRSADGTASFSRIGQDDMTAVVEEKQDFGVYSCVYAETFCEGKAYAVVNDCRFRADIDANAFVARQIPPVLVAESLYGSVECQQGEDTTTILFSEPAALESWVGEGKLIAASGTAILDSKGNLLQTEYHAEYHTEKVQYRLEVTVRVTAPETLDLSAMHVAHGQESILLEDLDAPRRLVQVVADVFSAEQILCTMEETIHSDAIPLSYSQSSRIALLGAGETLSADVSYEADMSNDRGSMTESSQTEQFLDGVYTVTVDGGEPAANESVTAEAMRQYCEDTILSGLFAVKYLQSAACEQTDETLRITFDGNETFSTDLTVQLSGFLQVDLEARAQSARTLQSGGYLTVDAQTGLPVSMGMVLQREHTIDGVTYQLSYSLEESLSFEAE